MSNTEDKTLCALQEEGYIESNPEEFKAQDYRIFGLPGKTGLSLTDLFGAAVGEKWIAYWDNGQSANYLVKHDGSKTFEIQTGRAFWIIYNGSLETTRQVNTAWLNDQNEAEIPLHTGWNLIANPFDFQIRWADVQSTNGISEPLHAFDNSFSTKTTMNPYEGYYFFNQSGLTVLRIPYTAGLGKEVVAKELNWEVKIHLSSGQLYDRSTRLGVVESATSGPDRFDYHKPRAIGSIPSVYFARPDWDQQYPLFASDVRQEIDQVEIWTFKTEVPGGGTARLDFPGVEEIWVGLTSVAKKY